MGGFLLVFWLVCLLFFFLFNSKHLSATNYQLLSTSLFQGEPGWAEEPQGRNYLSPTTHSWAPKRGRWNPGPRPCRDRTACREQACFSDQEGGRAAALVPSPWLCLPWTACLPPSPRGRLAKAPGVSWPALHSRQEASLSQRWQRSSTPTAPAPTAGLWSGPGTEQARKAYRRCEHTDRTWPLPTSPVGPRGSGAGQLLPSKERPSPGCGREGKGPGASPLSAGLPRGRCPALPAPCLLALPGQPAHGGPPPRLPLFLAVGGPARCLAHLSPLN